MSVIEAAGGLVWRTSAKGALRVLLVHRPRDGDWSLPKGKLLPGERPREGALREVAEETGLRCIAGPELAEVRYRDRKGRAKRVRYWAMEPVDGSFQPSREVDATKWCSEATARTMLTYAHDVDVLDALLDLLATAGARR
jgi:8-oxo-dGTP diphosphatase